MFQDMSDPSAQTNIGPGPDVVSPETVDSVPDNASDVVAWLQEDGVAPDQLRARADLAQEAEDNRTGDNRVSVTDAIEAARAQ